MTAADNIANGSDTRDLTAQKPSEVVALVAESVPVGRESVPVGRAAERAELIEPICDDVMPRADVTAELRALLSEAATILTIYAEVAVPVVNYRGQPLSEHAPRELVERIHRAIDI